MTAAVPISTFPLVPSFSKLTKEEEKDVYWEKLINDWMLPKHIKHFPGSHPVSLERKDLEFLKKNQDDFLVSLKSDGVRYILYMTLRPNTNTPVCFLIDRSRNMYEIEVWAPEEYYNGTIIDGELLWNLNNENTTTFLAFDLVKFKGKMYTKQPYTRRLQTLNDIIFDDDTAHTLEEIEDIIEEKDSMVSMNNLYNLKFKAKRFTSLNMLYVQWNDRHSTVYRHDGLIFTKNKDEYKHGSANYNTFKWKPCYSIDVVINNEEVYINEHNTDGLLKLDCILDRKISIIKNKIVFNENDVLECDIKLKNEVFELFPMRTRADKKYPNTLKTIISACTGLLDNVTIDELCQLF